MKKDRNCGMNMPIYPTYPMPNMMPGVPSMGTYSMGNSPIVGMPYDMGGMSGSFNSSTEQQLASLSSQVSSLERRVNNLENLVGNSSNSYNTSNYQML